MVTSGDGSVHVFFQPHSLGTNTVTAWVAGLQGSPVTFTTEVLVATIRLGRGGDRDATCSSGGFHIVVATRELPVPVGTAVEFVSDCTARFGSTAAPSGGEHFDSGLLHPGQRFRFVPGVAGTWTFLDQISRLTATLTAGLDAAEIYDRVSPSQFSNTSWYILYGDSTFLLEYDGWPAYSGRYDRADSTVTFVFDAASQAGPWVADGVIRGDSLIVAYNLVMQLSDFEDGVYVRRADAGRYD